MARPREFDTTTAINQALNIFRTQGYKGSSLQDLIQAMGISKSSFYETFGSKYELFLSTLTQFHESKAIYQTIDLSIDISAETLINDIFQQLINNVLKGQGGCLFGHCASEFSNSDQRVSIKIIHGMNQLEQLFYQILIREQKNRKIADKQRFLATAQQLTATFYGLQTMANAAIDKETLYQIAANATRTAILK